ncbi:hypothetical protein IMG5_085440 [Ichthyophthirius multifiliis]|uniref:Lipid-binding serum glycoprotein C-terminal domain-containing protein n=1 Tax=Ichthyophthirius multifiliis TaxID=5932 RepID=G0QQX9_ICHMU|nr:hypothetical protein IMG5_085440 [Ichthyophthirius multifiliis]EGR32375.1 hypothetical protein IMG5_085440 [Ichthyophthirius multifiliis]|eukprot:XP_004035861.1 hypothetical protein IMG5_085440 [Ichthyophthirius multifiliis]
MKFLFTKIIFQISFLYLILGLNDDQDFAELKLSINTLGFNTLINNVGAIVDPLISNKTNFTLPNISIDKIIHFDLTNLMISQHTIVWDKQAIQLSSLNTNQLQLQLQQISANLTGNLKFKFLFLNIESRFTLQIDELELKSILEFTPNAKKYPIGFSLALDKLNINYKQISFDLPDSPKWNKFLKPQIWILNKILPNIISIIVKPILNFKLNKLCKKPLSPQLKIGKYDFQFDLSFPQGIQVSQNLLKVPLNVYKIQNLNTSALVPSFQKNDLPDQYYKNNTYQDVELFLGTGIINQLIWILQSSELVNLFITQDNHLMQSVPLQLNLNGMQLLIPDLYQEYILKRGMQKYQQVYLNISLPQNDPNVRMVGGRLLGNLVAQLTFIVDTNKDRISPVKNYTECGKDCENAITLDLNLYFAVNVFSPGKLQYAIDVSNLMVIDAKKNGGILTEFDPKAFKDTINGLVQSILNTINGFLFLELITENNN